jgi:hypothetical protein
MSLSSYQTQEIEIEGEVFNLKKFRALMGLGIQKEIHECGLFGDEGIDVMKLSPELIFKIISNGCSKGSLSFDQKTFDSHFAGKYSAIFQLVAASLEYNYSNPNAQTDDTEEA